jgi:hypothetical protein
MVGGGPSGGPDGHGARHASCGAHGGGGGLHGCTAGLAGGLLCLGRDCVQLLDQHGGFVEMVLGLVECISCGAAGGLCFVLSVFSGALSVFSVVLVVLCSAACFIGMIPRGLGFVLLSFCLMLGFNGVALGLFSRSLIVLCIGLGGLRGITPALGLMCEVHSTMVGLIRQGLIGVGSLHVRFSGALSCGGEITPVLGLIRCGVGLIPRLLAHDLGVDGLGTSTISLVLVLLCLRGGSAAALLIVLGVMRRLLGVVELRLCLLVRGLRFMAVTCRIMRSVSGVVGLAVSGLGGLLCGGGRVSGMGGGLGGVIRVGVGLMGLLLGLLLRLA